VVAPKPKVHAAHRRNSNQAEATDAKCGVWWPKHVTEDRMRVTCGLCKKVLSAEDRKAKKIANSAPFDV
jgi:hypothetical protein